MGLQGEKPLEADLAEGFQLGLPVQGALSQDREPGASRPGAGREGVFHVDVAHQGGQGPEILLPGAFLACEEGVGGIPVGSKGRVVHGPEEGRRGPARLGPGARFVLQEEGDAPLRGQAGGPPEALQEPTREGSLPVQAFGPVRSEDQDPAAGETWGLVEGPEEGPFQCPGESLSLRACRPFEESRREGAHPDPPFLQEPGKDIPVFGGQVWVSPAPDHADFCEGEPSFLEKGKENLGVLVYLIGEDGNEQGGLPESMGTSIVGALPRRRKKVVKEHPVALVGCGGYGACLAEASRRIPGVVLEWGFDPRLGRPEALGLKPAPSFRALLEDPGLEALLLATPNSRHKEQVLAALEAGKAVYVEKPLAPRASEGEEMGRAAAEKGLTLVVGHNLEALAPLARFKEVLSRRGAPFLSVRGVASRKMGGPREEGAWRFDPRECPAGALHQLGIHLVGIFLSWFGPAREVTLERGREERGLLLEGALAWKAGGGLPIRVESDYLGRGGILEIHVETQEGEFHLVPGLIKGPGIYETWDVEEEFRRSRVVYLARFLEALEAGEPGNWAHALAASLVLDEGLRSC